LPTSNGAVNPIRQIANIKQISGTEWRGVTSAGVTASYDAEAAEVSDDAPTLAQPSMSVRMARAFVPYSIEIGQDWSEMQSEMAKLIQDAKDALEATVFISGLSTSNQPEGLHVGATAVVSTAAATTIAAADIYAIEEALPPRFQPNAAIISTRKTYNKVRALDTSGGSSLWVHIGDGLPKALLGYPNYIESEMTSAVTSGGSIMTIGDFSYYVIVDKIGLNVENIQHLFHTSNNLPSGQRGIFAYWRNTAKAVAWQAFRTMKYT
jgi:HK97 family phage major capsid protein